MNDEENYDFDDERKEMLSLLRQYGISSRRVLGAMKKVRRHMFIPEPYRWTCDPYGDHPCVIGGGQTISQPYIVAYMTELLDLKRGGKVLEIGTGSGYQAAVLAEVGVEVVSMEVRPELAEHARAVLHQQGYGRVMVLDVDGHKGAPDYGPYDAVIGTCAADVMPAVVVENLREGGRFVVPVGVGRQRLVVGKKVDGKLVARDDLEVIFVPMISQKGPDHDKG